MIALSPERRDQAERILAAMEAAQTLLWDLSLIFEKMVGFDVDTTSDLSNCTIEDLEGKAPR